MLRQHFNKFSNISVADKSFKYRFVQIRDRLYKIGNRFGIGIDLSSIDIHRGRDHGVPPFYHYVELCQSVKITSWSDLKIVISEEVHYII